MRGQERWAAVGLLAAVALMAGAASAATIEVGSAMIQPGESAIVVVSLHSGVDENVIATQNRVDFTRNAYIAADAAGDPDCAVEPSIQKEATGFRFLPLGCDPAVDCSSVRVFVLSFANLETIVDGPLYSCRVAVPASAADGDYPLTPVELGASGLGGAMIAVSGTAGEVSVVREPSARIVVGMAAGTAGATSAFSVSLDLLTDPPAEIAAAQIDVGFDVATAVPAGNGGAPACSVNAAIDKADSSFAFLPTGCAPGVDCSGVRAVIRSLSNATPIGDGSELFACSLDLSPNATPGSYPLPASNASATASAGEALPVLTGDGAVEVFAPPPPPPPCVGDCDGDGAVTINELLVGVNIVLGTAPLSSCPALESTDGSVTISELIKAVGAALGGCPTNA